MRLAQLDPGLALRSLGHEQLIAVLRGARETEGRLHVESPVAAQRARDLVDCREPVVAEVEPQVAAQPQTVVVGVRESAAAFDDRELAVLAHAKCRVLAPLGRHVGLSGIDTLRTFGGGDPQRRRWSRSSRSRRAPTCRRQPADA